MVFKLLMIQVCQFNIVKVSQLLFSIILYLIGAATYHENWIWMCLAGVCTIFFWIHNTSYGGNESGKEEEEHSEVNWTLACPDTSSVPEDSHRERDVNWLELPEHVLFLVAERLTRKKDLIRFGGVCHSWESVYVEAQRHRSPRLPLLMVATDLNHDDKTRSFYSLTHKTVSNSHVPVPHNRHCPGFSQGWLVTVLPDFRVSLVNPFSSVNNEICLPPLQAFEHGEDMRDGFYVGFLSKAVLSANPAYEPNYVVFGLYGANPVLGFFKPGDKTWTSLPSESAEYVDVIYYRDQFYAVNQDGAVFSCDLNGPDPKVVKVAPQTPPPKSADKRYLVESSSGDLLQILRYTGHEGISYFNDGFDIFKLNPVEQKWIELENTNGHILFLGDNSSLCVLASDFPECKPNSIYYTDDYYEGYTYASENDRGGGPHDIGVFSFDDCRITPHYPMKADIIHPPPIWIEPPVLRY